MRTFRNAQRRRAHGLAVDDDARAARARVDVERSRYRPTSWRSRAAGAAGRRRSRRASRGVRALTGCRWTDSDALGRAARPERLPSRGGSKPGCTTRTVVDPYRSGSSRSVSGVRPRQRPLTVTLAPLGVELTISVPVSRRRRLAVDERGAVAAAPLGRPRAVDAGAPGFAAGADGLLAGLAAGRGRIPAGRPRGRRGAVAGFEPLDAAARTAALRPSRPPQSA